MNINNDIYVPFGAEFKKPIESCSDMLRVYLTIYTETTQVTQNYFVYFK